MSLVVDDHALIDLLADMQTGWLRSEVEHSIIYTTAAWYFRLANAVQHGTGNGALSGRISRLEPEVRELTVRRIKDLPEWIGLIGPRLLVPVMAALDIRHRPNGLAAEALAVALLTNSLIAVSVDAPLIRAGAHDLGIEYHELG